MKPALLVALCFLAACVAEKTPPALYPQVHVGPGARVKPARVLVLTASCGSMESRCPREYIATVDNIVRSSLDFAGYALVDAATLRNQTRQRRESSVEEATDEASTTTTDEQRNFAPDRRTVVSRQAHTETERSVVELDGPGFDDLTVAERKAVLAEAGADSVLTVRIVVGAQHGVWTPNQSAEVLVKLGVDSGDTMAWASRCSASSNDFATISAALESAARCAVHGGTGN